jgi:hypothetical protein
MNAITKVSDIHTHPINQEDIDQNSAEILVHEVQQEEQYLSPRFQLVACI